MTSLKIDFKKELESASKGMIMIHDPKLLIKLIIRMIVRKLGVRHAAMVLHDLERDTYVLSISRGETGVKIPTGFTRFDHDSPLIKLFNCKEYQHLTIDRNAIVSDDISRLIWRESVLPNGGASNGDVQKLLYDVYDQMEMFNTVACVPAYHRHKLMAVLLLGEKYDNTKFEQEELDFFAALASDAAMAIRNAQLFNHLKREADRNHQQYLQTIMVLTHLIEDKDAYTRGHSDRVTEYALKISDSLMHKDTLKFSKKFRETLRISGLLHDIGKIGIPEAILNKNGKLTDEEYEIIKGHPTRGVMSLQPLGLEEECVKGILHHHERYDGRGYPTKLAGENIPMIAAIIAVADSYDAMTSDRPYRKGLPQETAIQEIRKNLGSQFNPIAAQAMIELYEKGKL
ncbi:MAG: HD-GYP domain-containing protein [Candidatus Omnitrophica bacterium]|nr:HD-GYP domain-containing protein [Candidatus Omnitrophota bacterium]